MKKIFIISIAVISLIMVLSPVAVFAGSPTIPNYGVVDPLKLWDPPPPWFSDVEKVIPAQNAPGGQIRVVTDGLSPTTAGGGAFGTIVFPCQSTIGFRYNIVTTGLVRLSRYSVSAETDSFEYSLTAVAGGVPIENFWLLPWTHQHIKLELGNFKTDANGLGGVKGTINLDAGRLYEATICVYDNDGIKVLEPTLEPNPNPPFVPPMVPDTSGFMVY